MEETSDRTTLTAVRDSWIPGKPDRTDYGAVITALKLAKIIGEGSVL